MHSVFLQAPAKLNLFLKVVNKRKDGYHNLETLFERIDLCDDIRLSSTKQDNIRIICNNPQVPRGPKNLVCRAAKLMKEKYGIKKGLEVNLTKRIPVAAGLGGGSSDAATTLMGLNKLWELKASKEELIQLGQELGSDIPFFIHECSWGLGTERGDVIKNVNIKAKLWHILVVPRIKMYSREVFTKLKMQLTKNTDNASILIRYLREKNITKLGQELHNDLEDSILRICPRLFNPKKAFEKLGITGIVFSGSGPSVFGLVKTRKEAENFRNILGQRYSQVFAVTTL
ncbi:MAG: 4-(cytidine 5'-diphospho)-2-C-methyl-D-erythritol kinase [Candidatus Omnitrophica bacterium]|nr:4-(cytidine 5'-diphospho)-2-C-methyl-D-erythritol kinase [Candidatus Omnitrophota bacterium]